MKIITVVSLLVLLSACSQNNIRSNKKSRKVGVHNFISKAPAKQMVNWYYIRNENTSGEKGYYFESKTPLENFIQSDFVYYDSKPEQLNKLYPLKEKIILVEVKNLPPNLQRDAADLESITVND